MTDKSTVFSTLVTDDEDCKSAYLMIKSLRHFGGALKDAPFLIFTTGKFDGLNMIAKLGNVQLHSVEDANLQTGYFFRSKICAWVQAEELSNHSQSLIWIDPSCLVIREPGLFILDAQTAAAFRPVHIQNVGQSIDKDMDGFWKEIYHQCNAPIWHDGIESFVDEQKLLPYFNSHSFCINPKFGLLARTKNNIETIANNKNFMENYCADKLHKIFFFQAVLSATVISQVKKDAIRILPPEYGYPFHLHDKIKAVKQITRMDDITLLVYEDSETLHLAFQQLPVSPELANFYSSINK